LQGLYRRKTIIYLEETRIKTFLTRPEPEETRWRKNGRNPEKPGETRKRPWWAQPGYGHSEGGEPLDKAIALVAAAHVDAASLDLEKSPALHRCGVRIAGPYCVSAILVGFFGFGSTERGERVAMAALSSSTTVAARCAKGTVAVTRAESTRALCSSAWQVGCCPVEQLRCRAKLSSADAAARLCALPRPQPPPVRLRGQSRPSQ
jgi:hypothetical protein